MATTFHSPLRSAPRISTLMPQAQSSTSRNRGFPTLLLTLNEVVRDPAAYTSFSIPSRRYCEPTWAIVHR